MSENISISLPVADRKYTLTIKREDEEIVRAAINALGIKIKAYAENYAFNDKQDLLAMVLIEFAIRNEKNIAEKQFVNEELHKRLENIDGLLTESV